MVQIRRKQRQQLIAGGVVALVLGVAGAYLLTDGGDDPDRDVVAVRTTTTSSPAVSLDDLFPAAPTDGSVPGGASALDEVLGPAARQLAAGGGALLQRGGGGGGGGASGGGAAGGGPGTPSGPGSTAPATVPAARSYTISVPSEWIPAWRRAGDVFGASLEQVGVEGALLVNDLLVESYGPDLASVGPVDPVPASSGPVSLTVRYSGEELAKIDQLSKRTGLDPAQLAVLGGYFAGWASIQL